MKLIVWCTLFIFFIGVAAAGTVIQRRDANGNVVFTDIPETGSELKDISLETINKKRRKNGQKSLDIDEYEYIKKSFDEAKADLDSYQLQMLQSCGKEPTESWIINQRVDEDRKLRWIRWEECSLSYKSELEKKKEIYRGTKTKYDELHR